MKKINLSLSVDEVNKILEALSQLPFGQVHQLIARIHSGACAQVLEKNDTVETEEKVKTLAHG